MKSGNYIDTINAVVSWYRQQKDFNAEPKTIDALNRARRQLACAMIDLGRDVSKAKAGKEAAYFNRKKKYADRKLTLKADNWSATDAADKATLDIEEWANKEVEATRQYEHARLLFDSVHEILNAISSDLRALENEYKRSGQAQPA